MKQYPKVTRIFPDRQPVLIRQPAPVSGAFALLVCSAIAVGGAVLAGCVLPL